MLVYPNLDPIAFSYGSIKIYWYGITYLFGLLGAWILLKHNKKSGIPEWLDQEIWDLIFFAAVGIILGGRLGYVLFYDLQLVYTDPVSILDFRLGRSFHGGLLGVIVAIWYFARSRKRNFWACCDYVAPAVPIGLGFGRLGNFINGELFGRPTDLPWGMVFPTADNLVRHPSQLYELLLEGFVLFFILNSFFCKKAKPAIGATAALFLLSYGVLRFVVEYSREPDLTLGFIFTYFTMGQILCIPMILLGSYLFVRFSRAQS